MIEVLGSLMQPKSCYELDCNLRTSRLADPQNTQDQIFVCRIASPAFRTSLLTSLCSEREQDCSFVSLGIPCSNTVDFRSVNVMFDTGYWSEIRR
jgi:hypothetical protein